MSDLKKQNSMEIKEQYQVIVVMLIEERKLEKITKS
jgi:hypothetical protein